MSLIAWSLAWLVVGVATVMPPSAASAAFDDAPLLRQRGHLPLKAVSAPPAVAARGPLVSEWQVSLEQGNTFAGGVEGGEALLIDGESGELVVRHRRALGRCWQGEAVLPFAFHHGGWADQVIDDWHQRFGLPDAQRDLSTNFDLRYAWVDAKGELRRHETPAAGLADVRLFVQRPLACGVAARRSALVRFGVKLPSGDAERLLGSGAHDLYVDVQSPVFVLGERWRFATSIGLLAAGRSELFRAQRALLGYGSFGASLRVHRRWEALAQIDWHTAAHDSALRELGEFAASLAIGARYRLTDGQRLELSVSEDAVIDTYPDVVLRLAWTWRRR